MKAAGFCGIIRRWKALEHSNLSTEPKINILENPVLKIVLLIRCTVTYYCDEKVVAFVLCNQFIKMLNFLTLTQISSQGTNIKKETFCVFKKCSVSKTEPD